MTSDSLTLFGERMLDSPFVLTAFVALKEKGLPFSFRILNLSAGEQREAEFVDHSLTGRVPTLNDGDFWLSESVAIVEYLDETRPAPDYPRLLPADTEQRARARQLLGWLRSDLTALRRERPTSSVFFQPVSTPLDEAARADADKLERIAIELTRGRATLFGQWSIADVDLTLALMRLIKNGDPLPGALVAYAESNWHRPSMDAWVALPRPVKAKVLSA